MAAMKPRTGDGPLEVVKEGRGIVLRMPLEGGGRLVVEMTPDEAAALRDAIQGCDGVNCPFAGSRFERPPTSRSGAVSLPHEKRADAVRPGRTAYVLSALDGDEQALAHGQQ